MKLKTLLLSSSLLAFTSISIAAHSIQATARMHYGLPNTSTLLQAKAGYADSIVITNETNYTDTVRAWFVDGSSADLPIYPVSNFPYNVISIDPPYSYPYVTMEVDHDGMVISGPFTAYPGDRYTITPLSQGEKVEKLQSVKAN